MFSIFTLCDPDGQVVASILTEGFNPLACDEVVESLGMREGILEHKIGDKVAL